MAWHVGAALDMVEILRLHLLLVSLPVVEVVEVGNNDRDREGDGQHAGNGTQGPYYFSPHTDWPVFWFNGCRRCCGDGGIVNGRR